jgi:dienelactone hydrolase
MSVCRTGGRFTRSFVARTGWRGKPSRMVRRCWFWRCDHLRALTVVLVVAAGLAGCTGGRADVDAVMSVSPSTALLDAPVTVSVRGLPAGARTTVTATATDADGTTWSASADFQATSAGTVSLDQPSLGGSYTGANPMGLFEFMTPQPSSTTAVGFQVPGSGSYEVTLSASVDGSVVFTAGVRRQTPAEVGVSSRMLSVAADGVYGTLFQPAHATVNRPAVLLFGGSEGGLHPAVALAAAVLAAHGHPTLALAYFKAPGLPDTLTAIPLEYFAKALAVLRAQPGVDPRHVFVMGASRGGEAALLLGSSFPGLVNGVIGLVPGSYVNSALPDTGRSPWTLHGRDLPHAGAAQFGAPAASIDPRAVIPVERIRGPILLICGDMDVQWPSCSNVEDIANRLTANQFRFAVQTLRYPAAGHLGIDPPYTSITTHALATAGGTLPATQAARSDIHTQLLKLLTGQRG